MTNCSNKVLERIGTVLSPGHHPLEGDGLSLANLYHYLWKRNKHLKGCHVMVPETVVFDGMVPRYWYTYDEKNQEIKKKGLREVSIMAIKREFLKGHSHAADRDSIMQSSTGNINNTSTTTQQQHQSFPLSTSSSSSAFASSSSSSLFASPSCSGSGQSEIVAQYMYTSGVTPEGESIVSVDFLAETDLDEFLTNRQKKGGSMLQRFVHPKGVHNTVIQAIWSPHYFNCERRHNLRKLSDSRFSLFDRAATYEGPFPLSKQAICAPKMKCHIREICKSVVQHVTETERKTISRMVLHFKVDVHGRVWLLWSNCLRLSDKLTQTRVPLNLSQIYSAPLDEISCNNNTNLSNSKNRTTHHLKSGGRQSSASPERIRNAKDENLRIQKNNDSFMKMTSNDGDSSGLIDASTSSSRNEVQKSRRGILIIPKDIKKCPNCNAPFHQSDQIFYITVEDVVQYHSWQRHNVLRRNRDNNGEMTTMAMKKKATILYDSAQKKRFPLHSRSLSNSKQIVTLDEEAYRGVLAESAAVDSRYTREMNILSTLNAQLDNVIYEAYSHFQHSHRPFAFELQVDSGAVSHQRLMKLLENIPNCNREIPQNMALESPSQASCDIASELMSFKQMKETSFKNVIADSLGPVLLQLAETREEHKPFNLSVQTPKAKLKKELSCSADSEYNLYSSDEEIAMYDSEVSISESDTLQKKSSTAETPLATTHWIISWSPGISLLELQRSFSGAKEAVKQFLLPLYRRSHKSAAGSADFLVSPIQSLQPAISSFGSPDDGSQVPTSPIKISSAQLNLLRSEDGNKNNNNNNNNNNNVANKVPAVIISLFPFITSAQFVHLSSEVPFLNQRIPLCEVCFLLYTDVTARDLQAFHNRCRLMKRCRQKKVSASTVN